MTTDANSEQLFLTRVREEARTAIRHELKALGQAELLPAVIGGKMFRSRLAYCVAGVSSEELVHSCAAMELLHSSTLVHDDIVDGAELRRGEASVNGVLGDHAALYIGNLLRVVAQQFASSFAYEVRSALADAIRRVDVAQYQEVVDRGSEMRTIEDYLEVCKGKTSAMLELAVRLGLATGTSAQPQEVTSLVEAAELVGYAFQIMDDVADAEAWLSSRSTGEGPGTERNKQANFDFAVGNFTYPILILGRVESVDTIPDRTIADALDESRAAAESYVEAAAAAVRSIATDEHESPRVRRALSWLEVVRPRLIDGGIDAATRE